jgi:hypothetical protein
MSSHRPPTQSENLLSHPYRLQRRPFWRRALGELRAIVRAVFCRGPL